MDVVCRKATGKAAEPRGKIERRKAKHLLQRAGLDGAKAAIDRFAQHWHDEPALHDQARASRAGAKPWRFSFQHVLLTFGRWPCGCYRLREWKKGARVDLRYVPKHLDPRSCPRLKAPAPVVQLHKPPTKRDATAALEQLRAMGLKVPSF